MHFYPELFGLLLIIQINYLYLQQPFPFIAAALYDTGKDTLYVF